MKNDQTQFIHDTGTLLSECVARTRPYWQQRRRHIDVQTPVKPRLNVFILGNLAIDLTLLLETSLQQLVDAIKTGDEKLRDEWMPTVSVGGFAAWAARAASRIGARISISSVIPLPTPRLFGEFFEEVDADTTCLTAYPGPAPASIELATQDNQHLLICRNGLANVEPRLPTDLSERFDCVLMNPGGPSVRRAVLRSLSDANHRGGRMPVVAIAARSDWTTDDLELIRDRGHYVFFNRREVLRTAERIAGNGRMRIDEAAGTIKDAIGNSKLVVTLGREGAMLLNGGPERYHSRALAVDKSTTGCSDMLTAFTAIRRAQGFEEEASLDKGVAAVSEELLSR